MKTNAALFAIALLCASTPVNSMPHPVRRANFWDMTQGSVASTVSIVFHPCLGPKWSHLSPRQPVNSVDQFPICEDVAYGANCVERDYSKTLAPLQCMWLEQFGLRLCSRTFAIPVSCPSASPSVHELTMAPTLFQSPANGGGIL